MGLNDAQEMLDAAKAQGIIDERQIASLERRLAAIRRLIATEQLELQTSEGASHAVVEVWKLERVLDTPDDQEDQP